MILLSTGSKGLILESKISINAVVSLTKLYILYSIPSFIAFSAFRNNVLKSVSFTEIGG